MITLGEPPGILLRGGVIRAQTWYGFGVQLELCCKAYQRLCREHAMDKRGVILTFKEGVHI
jgi:hypothetical protein